MGEKHVVRFEPVGIEIEVDEDQTILRAAAEQGIMLMHGCKEGQCAVLQVLRPRRRRHRARQVLDLRAARLRAGGGLHPAVPGARLRGPDDRAAQLRRGDDPLRPADPGGRRRGRVQRAGHPRHAAPGRSGWSSPTEIKFFPGQYVDITIPGTDETRSFSMANTSSRESGQLEFVIRVYPDGLFSEFLDTRARRRRPARRRPGRSASSRCARAATATWCSSAAAPAWRRSCRCCGPWPSAASTARPPSTTAPGRQQDLCFEEELRAARGDAARLPLRAGPVRAGRRRRLGRRDRPDHRRGRAARDRPRRARRLRLRAAADGRGGHGRCSPTLGAAEKRIYYDKFTTTGDRS